jgi:ankyrin repeat protein
MLDVARMLLDRGALINLQSREGDTALMRATKNGWLNVASILLDHGALINVRNSVGDTALMIAEARNSETGNRLALYRLLQSHGAQR